THRDKLVLECRIPQARRVCILMREIEVERVERDPAQRIESDGACVRTDENPSPAKRLRAFGEDRAGGDVGAHRSTTREAVRHAARRRADGDVTDVRSDRAAEERDDSRVAGFCRRNEVFPVYVVGRNQRRETEWLAAAAERKQSELQLLSQALC